MTTSKSTKVVAIIQARMRSTRLPQKVLADLAGQPMLAQVAARVRRARHVDEVVIATSDQPADDALAAFCEAHNLPCFRGSESDVLDRFHCAARRFDAGTIVRINGDCPLTDPAVIDKVIARFLNGDCDYVTNTLRYTYPDGLDAEVFSRAALDRAWHEARLPAEREHVTPYLREAARFRIANVEAGVDLSAQQWRWTVDTPEDLEFVRKVYALLEGDGAAFGLDSVVRLLEENPALLELNAHSARNEGYYRSLTEEPPIPPRVRELARSRTWLARAEKLIPTCSQTFSKCPTQFVQGVAPNFIERGAGCRVWDVDGNEYIDWAMALAPIVLGHADPDVTAAVTTQIADGTAYSLPHPLEVEVAEMLVDLIPCAEMVRFGKNGSDATAGAVRVARAFTGREVIAMCGYHGWQDWCIGTTTRNLGVPKAVRELTKTFAYNDLSSLERVFAENPGQVAAVVMEPIGVVAPQPGFLAGVQALCQQHGALLVFDEIVTGFRWAIGGAQEYFAVTPDLACCGKAMGNGFPIAAVVGRRDVMRLMDEIFFSFTFGGETASLVAAKAVLTKLQREPVIAHLWEQGQRVLDGFNTMARIFGVEKLAKCVGHAPRTVVLFSDESGAESLLYKSLFQQECLKRGVLFSGGHNLSYSHGAADVDATLRVYRTALEILAEAAAKGDAAQRLEGPPVQAVFRKA